MNLPAPVPGRVYIIGAGPGDPGLLTLKGAHYLERAEVLLYDALVDPRLLALAPDSCERIYVGKRGGRPSSEQVSIDQLLEEYGRQGRVVVRLKGGDPYVFGRGGEEALHLQKAGIPFEVVAGVTAASAVPTYAGIPLTHRGLASAAVLVTGHEDPTKSTPPIDWPRLAGLEATLVIFMGTRKLAQLSALLLAGGRPPDTPAAVIEWGTWPQQRTVTAPLQDIAARAAAAGVRAPALVVVGQVVSLRPYLNWFENRALFGRRVLVTRSQDQAAGLQVKLEAEGAQVEMLPLLEIGPPSDWRPLDAALARLADFAWVLFTSPNSVRYFFARLQQQGGDARWLGGVRLAAVGQATAAALAQHGLRPDLVPSRQSQEGLIAALEAEPIAGRRFLLPASDIGRTELVEYLLQRGAQVERVNAYQNQMPELAEEDWPPALQGGDLDLVVFASPSSVANFWRLLGPERARQILGGAVACIGPTTAQAVREQGIDVQIQPEHSSVEALVQAIVDYFRRQKEAGV
ncbi:MAG: uroporphyrinogen-III C-methyltransferase [Candidatus Latescibacteria bacterium]|nr:uroporphyrinogen-III C-methyltransferase [Candidatus Latescibacterota bacterium]